MSFDTCLFGAIIVSAVFQSLWNRAMSFDLRSRVALANKTKVSIPLEQGNVFRPSQWNEEEQASIVSIPLEQGNVFRLQ